MLNLIESIANQAFEKDLIVNIEFGARRETIGDFLQGKQRRVGELEKMITGSTDDCSIASFQKRLLRQYGEPIVPGEMIADLENSLVEAIDQTIVIREFRRQQKNVADVIELEVSTLGK